MAGRTVLAAVAVGGLAVGLMTAGSSTAADRPATRSAITITPATPRANYPHLIVTKRAARLAPGYLFTGPKIAVHRPGGAPVGPMIVDAHGRPVYFTNEPRGERAYDVRVQRYHGRRVLTYWLGTTGVNPGSGVGDDYIINQHYKVIRVVRGHGRGCQADQHEFLLTPGNSAIIECYEVTHADARSVGGAANQAVVDCVVQEINLATGKVVFEWHSLDHVPLGDSEKPVPAKAHKLWDYFHINSVTVDSDHNLIISSRHTWTVYKVDRHTGKVIWRLGGKRSSFTIGRGAAFSWQHDAEPIGNNGYRIFDNAWNHDRDTPKTHPVSRVLTIRLNLARHTATRLAKLIYPVGTLLAGSQGNSQALPGNHLLVGWGAANHISEFDARRNMRFDAHFRNRYDTYRAYKSRWVGTPDTGPALRVSAPGGVRQVDAAWNGASTVARWRVLGGPAPGKLHRVASTPWNGYDTAFRLSRWPAYLRLAAIDSHGNVIRRTGVRDIR
jgi:hypothetical protein